MKHRMFGWVMLLFMFGERLEARERVDVTIENGIARTEVRSDGEVNVPEGAALAELQEANGEVRFVYYAPAILKDGAVHYEYTPAANGQPRAAVSHKCEGASVQLNLEIKTAQEIQTISAPEGAGIFEDGNGSSVVQCESEGEPIIVTYELKDAPRGRVQMWAYRAAGAELGTFILAVEPGRIELSDDARVEFAGDRVVDTVQLGNKGGITIIGSYRSAGGVRVTARDAVGEIYAMVIDLPEVDEDTPEIERVWFAASAQAFNENETDRAARIAREQAARAIRNQQVAWNAQIDLGRPMFGSPVETETAKSGDDAGCGCLMAVMPGAGQNIETEISTLKLIEEMRDGF